MHVMLCMYVCMYVARVVGLAWHVGLDKRHLNMRSRMHFLTHLLQYSHTYSRTYSHTYRFWVFWVCFSQHYTWYCTNKETELLAFMNMAQQSNLMRKHHANDQDTKRHQQVGTCYRRESSHLTSAICLFVSSS